MSIWQTRWDAEIPRRDPYGRTLGDEPTVIDVAASPNMSDVLRLTIVDAWAHDEVVVMVTPDEARRLAAALEAAAAEYAT